MIERIKSACRVMFGKSVLVIADGNVYSRGWKNYLLETSYIQKEGEGNYTIRVRLSDDMTPNIAIWQIRDEDDDYAYNRAVEVYEYLNSD